MGYASIRNIRFPRHLQVLCAALLIAVWVAAFQVVADDAPGAPGDASGWASAAKDFVGTSASDTSRVYFTGAQGIVTEVFYPTVDQMQNVDLQFLVVDSAKSWGPENGEEKRQTKHEVRLVNNRALAWDVQTTANNGEWSLRKVIFTDPARASLVQRVTFRALQPGKTVSDYNVFVLNNPAINNSNGGGSFAAGNDNSRTLQSGGRTIACASQPSSTSSALACSRLWKVVSGHTMLSSGFVSRNDGWSDLFGGASDKTMDWHFDNAAGGNVAQMGWIDFGADMHDSISFDLVLAFGNNEAEAMSTANTTLNSDLSALQTDYVGGWVTYTSGLDTQGGLADDQYYLAAMVLKTSQDKSNGAMVAGPGTPWGESSDDGNRAGYHVVWARDLFKFANALLAAGDRESVRKAVDYLFDVQMQTVDLGNPGEPGFSRRGRFPQNTFVDGTPYWNGTQMDEVAMPIVLAWKLHQVAPLDIAARWPRIKLAAEYLAHAGPRTDQDRWEEMAGYSPSTIAAEIAGLICAAELADAAADPAAAGFYRQKADEWRNNVANWTFTTSGFHGNGKYYIRINANEDPNDDVKLAFKNGVGTHGERYIVDGGFLELVRMGALSPSDWTILETLPEYDAILKQTVSGVGDLFFRYNFDGYGEKADGGDFRDTGIGRLWPIFTAERGIYEISRTGDGTQGQRFQDTLKAVATPPGMIPEQVWNVGATITGWPAPTPAGIQPGTATRSMRPLNWAMGEYINLIVAMNRGVNDAPAAVVRRYNTDVMQATVTFRVRAETQPGQDIYLVGDNPLLSEWAPQAGIKLSPASYPIWSVTLSLPVSTALQYKYVRRNGQGQATWEGGDNRSFTTPTSGTATRNDEFR